MSRARDAVATGTSIESSPELDAALRQGAVSLDQAAEITRAEQAAPGAAKTLVEVARDEAFHVLKDKARKIKLEAEQHRDLAARQHQARRARSHQRASESHSSATWPTPTPRCSVEPAGATPGVPS